MRCAGEILLYLASRRGVGRGYRVGTVAAPCPASCCVIAGGSQCRSVDLPAQPSSAGRPVHFHIPRRQSDGRGVRHDRCERHSQGPFWGASTAVPHTKDPKIHGRHVQAGPVWDTISLVPAPMRPSPTQPNRTRRQPSLSRASLHDHKSLPHRCSHHRRGRTHASGGMEHTWRVETGGGAGGPRGFRTVWGWPCSMGRSDGPELLFWVARVSDTSSGSGYPNQPPRDWRRRSSRTRRRSSSPRRRGG